MSECHQKCDELLCTQTTQISAAMMVTVLNSQQYQQGEHSPSSTLHKTQPVLPSILLASAKKLGQRPSPASVCLSSRPRQIRTPSEGRRLILE